MEVEDTISVMRTEKKYLLSYQKKNILENRLSGIMKRDEYGRMGRYFVRSLYFDSIYDDDLFDKINGLEYRKKIRLRIYHPEQKWVKLELKQKRGAVQNKKTIKISRENAEQMMEGRYDFLLKMQGPLSTALYQIMEQGVYRPKCLIEYHRAAFVEETNNTRITIDSETGVTGRYEKFFSDRISLQPLLKYPTLEVKYNGFLLDYIKEMLEIADFTEVSLSKYEMSRLEMI